MKHRSSLWLRWLVTRRHSSANHRFRWGFVQPTQKDPRQRRPSCDLLLSEDLSAQLLADLKLPHYIFVDNLPWPWMSHFDLTAFEWTKRYSPCNGARYLGSTQSQRTWNPPSCGSCPFLFDHTPEWSRYSLPIQTRQLVLPYFHKLSPEYCPGHRHNRTKNFSRSKVRGFLQYLYRVLVHLAPVLDIPLSIRFFYLWKLKRSVKRNFQFFHGLVAA